MARPAPQFANACSIWPETIYLHTNQRSSRTRDNLTDKHFSGDQYVRFRRTAICTGPQLPNLNNAWWWWPTLVSKQCKSLCFMSKISLVQAHQNTCGSKRDETCHLSNKWLLISKVPLAVTFWFNGAQLDASDCSHTRLFFVLFWTVTLLSVESSKNPFTTNKNRLQAAQKSRSC